MTLLGTHPERNVIRVQLRQNKLLKDLSESDRAELESHLVVVDGNKGDFLLHQGVREMEQYFIVDGILKRVVSNSEGKEMILRFADEHDMETSYAASRLGTPTPYGIVCVTKGPVPWPRRWTSSRSARLARRWALKTSPRAFTACPGVLR